MGYWETSGVLGRLEEGQFEKYNCSERAVLHPEMLPRQKQHFLNYMGHPVTHIATNLKPVIFPVTPLILILIPLRRAH